MKLTVLLCLAILPLATNGQMTKILGRPTNHSIAVNVLFDKAVNVKFNFGIYLILMIAGGNTISCQKIVV